MNFESSEKARTEITPEKETKIFPQLRNYGIDSPERGDNMSVSQLRNYAIAVKPDQESMMSTKVKHKPKEEVETEPAEEVETEPAEEVETEPAEEVETEPAEEAKKEVRCSIRISEEDWRRIQGVKTDTRKPFQKIMIEALHNHLADFEEARRQAKPSRPAIPR